MDQKAILETLDGHEETMVSLCANGIHTYDEYERSLEIVDLLMRFDKPTVVQRLSLESLVSVVGDYEDKHYPL